MAQTVGKREHDVSFREPWKEIIKLPCVWAVYYINSLFDFFYEFM